MIYLDYASNTPADPAVLDIFIQTEQSYIGNANANHQAGRSANEKMKDITKGIAQLLDVKPEEIIYTSGASEANNLALKGLARSYRHKGRHIISTCLEHSSVSGAQTALQDQGYEIDLVDILPDGKVDLAHLKELLREDTIIVSVSWVDSELGTIQPIEAIAALLKQYPGCYFHVDATQAVGKIPIFFDGVDCMVFAPHKFYGLNGCGILLKREGVILEPLIHGGQSTTIYRSGTPAISLAVATFKALDLAVTQQNSRTQYVQDMREFLLERLSTYTHVRINSPKHASPYIVNLSVTGVRADDFQKALDEKGVCVSTKSACAVPGTPSRPVYAVTGNRKNALCSWRISLSHLTCQDDLDGFMQAFDSCYKELTK